MKIEEKGYKLYPQNKEGYWTVHNLYQKRVDHDKVCETNEKLFINIYEYKASENGPMTYEMGIKAESNGLWWDLKVYGVSEERLETEFNTLEQKLIELWEIAL